MNLKATIPSTKYDRSRIMEDFKYLGSTATYAAKCTREIKWKNEVVKAAFNTKIFFFTNKLDLNLGGKLTKCYILSIALYDI